ncbi:uncharacterized protein DDB_G0290685-like [Ctenocephalides felis]|uniref:uncharacterized protein DDB_G0290685-like n=1 Tax=Ctenocephalides felis TaxID=7515 RepID=UPI000E6E18BC|nr:uncharacterized protein DDB_G0290685-like [Ctenocephalides felis]
MHLAIVLLVSSCVLSSYGFNLLRNPSLNFGKNDISLTKAADRFTNSFSPSWNMASGSPWSIPLVLGGGASALNQHISKLVQLMKDIVAKIVKLPWTLRDKYLKRLQQLNDNLDNKKNSVYPSIYPDPKEQYKGYEDDDQGYEDYDQDQRDDPSPYSNEKQDIKDAPHKPSKSLENPGSNKSGRSDSEISTNKKSNQETTTLETTTTSRPIESSEESEDTKSEGTEEPGQDYKSALQDSSESPENQEVDKSGQNDPKTGKKKVGIPDKSTTTSEQIETLENSDGKENDDDQNSSEGKNDDDDHESLQTSHNIEEKDDVNKSGEQEDNVDNPDQQKAKNSTSESPGESNSDELSVKIGAEQEQNQETTTKKPIKNLKKSKDKNTGSNLKLSEDTGTNKNQDLPQENNNVIRQIPEEFDESGTDSGEQVADTQESTTLGSPANLNSSASFEKDGEDDDVVSTPISSDKKVKSSKHLLQEQNTDVQYSKHNIKIQDQGVKNETQDGKVVHNDNLNNQNSNRQNLSDVSSETLENKVQNDFDQLNTETSKESKQIQSTTTSKPIENSEKSESKNTDKNPKSTELSDGTRKQKLEEQVKSSKNSSKQKIDNQDGVSKPAKIPVNSIKDNANNNLENSGKSESKNIDNNPKFPKASDMGTGKQNSEEQVESGTNSSKQNIYNQDTESETNKIPENSVKDSENNNLENSGESESKNTDENPGEQKSKEQAKSESESNRILESSITNNEDDNLEFPQTLSKKSQIKPKEDPSYANTNFTEQGTNKQNLGTETDKNLQIFLEESQAINSDGNQSNSVPSNDNKKQKISESNTDSSNQNVDIQIPNATVSDSSKISENSTKDEKNSQVLSPSESTSEPNIESEVDLSTVPPKLKKQQDDGTNNKQVLSNKKRNKNKKRSSSKKAKKRSKANNVPTSSQTKQPYQNTGGSGASLARAFTG